MLNFIGLSLDMAASLRTASGSSGHHVRMESTMDITLPEYSKGTVKLPALDSEALCNRLYSQAPTQAARPPDGTTILAFHRPTNTQTRITALPREPNLEPLVRIYLFQ